MAAGVTPTATPSATTSPTVTATATATPGGITIRKKVNTNAALPGQTVQYTIDVHSTVGGNGVQITRVMDALPPDFGYVAGTSRFQVCSPCASAGAQDPTITTSNGRSVLTWARGDLLQNGLTDLVVTFRATVATSPGVYANAAAATDNLGQTARIVGAAPVTVATPTATPTATSAAILSADVAGMP